MKYPCPFTAFIALAALFTAMMSVALRADETKTKQPPAKEAPAAGAAAAEAPVPGAPKDLDAIVSKALAAYNSGDSKAFFADYAPSMKAICTPQMFEALYTNAAMTQFGKYESRTYLKETSVSEIDTPLLNYKAKFAKDKDVLVAVNFTKEGGSMKIMQITIQDLPAE